MTTTRTFRVVFLWLLLPILAHATTNGLLFEATFDLPTATNTLSKLASTTNASAEAITRLQLAAWTPSGVITGVVPQGMTPEFTPGVRGQAFQTRGDKHEWNMVSFNVSNLWPAAQGTLAYWTKGDNISVTWDNGFMFSQLSGANGWMWFYKPGRHPWFGWLSRYVLPGQKNETDSYLFVPETTAYHADYNIWRLWVTTWSGNRARLYLDGMLLAETPNFTWPDSIQTLRLFNGTGNMAIRFDDLRIYDRPLDPDEQRRIWHETLRPLNTSRVAVPLARVAVTVDGQLAPGEWADATELQTVARGADGLLESEPTTFLIKHDATNLYMAARSPWPAAVARSPAMTAGMTGLLKSAQTVRDGDLTNDDHFRFDLLPGFPSGRCYRFAVNGDNVVRDWWVAGESGDVQWDSTWSAKTSKDDKAWYVEATFPLRELGANATWGLNVHRVWRALKQQTDSWVWGERWTQKPANANSATTQDVSEPAGEMTLGGGDIVAVSDVAFGSPDQGEVRFRVAVTNPARSEVFLWAKLQSSSGEVRRDFTNEPHGRLRLAPGESFRMEHAQQLRNPSTADLFFLLTTADATSNVVYRSEVQFLREQRLEVTLWNYPSTHTMRLRLVASRLQGQPLADTAAVVELIPEGATKPSLAKTIKPLSGAEQEIALDTKRLPVGRYVVRATLSDAGKELFRNESSFEKLPLPPWYDNKEGVSDKVPPPFTALELKGRAVKAWGREYAFGDRLLPQEIHTQGLPLLRGPVRAIATMKDKAIDTSVLPGKIAWKLRKPTRFEGRGQVHAGKVTVRNDLWIEYDGLIWNTLTVAGTKSDTLQSLVLEIPFTKEFSDVINPSDYGLRTTGLLATNGYKSAAHTVWLGNGYGGLQWTHHSRANWSNANPAEEFQVVPGPDGATMRVTFRDVPTALDRPVTISFGLQATPVKPRYPEYRRWLSGDPKIHWEYAWYPGEQVFRPGAEGWIGWQLIQSRPADYLQNTWWRDSSARRLCEKVYNGPYVTTDIVDASLPDFAQFGDEWSTEADRKFVPDPNSKSQSSYACAGVKSYRDFFVWRYARLMDKQPFAALYYDVSGGVSCGNPFNGTGVRDRDGNLVPTNGMLGLRDIAKRLYTLIKLRYPDGIIKYHNSGIPCLPFMSFAEASVDGENTFSLLSAQKRDYHGTMRPDTWRAEYMGHNFGFVTDFLPQLTRAEKWTYAQLATPEGLAVSDHLIGQTLLHDSYIWASYISSDALIRLQQALRRHGWGNQYRMIPYWEQKVVTLPANLFATFFVEPETGSPAPQPIDADGRYYRSVPGPAKRVICVFHNDSPWNGELRLKLDWAQLGISSPAACKVENAVHRFTFPILDKGAAATGKIDPKAGEEQFLVKYTEDPREFARVENNELVFPMTPWNYRLIVLWKE